MASAPSQALRRRSSPTEQASSPQASSSPRQAQSSSDSDAVLINSQAESAASAKHESHAPVQEVRRCWVCMGDETDDPENNIWRSPCPCSLTAHETCLLEWIADKEAPPPGQIAHAHEIKCPQCQTPLNIKRPREDPLVIFTDTIQKAARSLIIPTALCSVAGCLYSGFLIYGVNAMGLVFGSEYSDALLAIPTLDFLKNRHAVGRWADTALAGLSQLFPFFPRMRAHANIPYYLGLPLIAPSLIMWRTSYGDIGFSMLIPIVSPIYQSQSCY